MTVGPLGPPCLGHRLPLPSRHAGRAGGSDRPELRYGFCLGGEGRTRTAIEYLETVPHRDEASFGESLNGHAELHIDKLRAARAKPAMTNLLARQRLDLFASTYAGETVHGANGLLDGEGKTITPDRSWFVENQARVIASLKSRSVI